MPHQNVLLLGATGNLGGYILNALLSASPGFTITVLVRSTSKTTSLPSSVQTLTLPEEPTPQSLSPLLKGQDVVICTLPGSNISLQKALADAALSAGVKLFIPADFGSCDSTSPRVLEALELYRAKAEVREYLIEVAARPEAWESGFGWTSLVCGHFFDHGLESELLGFDVKGRKVRLFDGGAKKWSACTRERIGEAVVKILEKDGDEIGEGGKGVRGRVLFVQTFCVSQQHSLARLKSVMAEEDQWSLEMVESGGLIKGLIEDVKKTGNADKREELVGVMGLVDGDWRARDGFAMDLLGLKDEDLEEVVRKVLKI